MKRSNLLSITLALCTITGCSDAVPLQPAPTPNPRTAVASGQPDKTTERSDPKAYFHANNRADWVGQAHNKGLADIYARLLKGHVSGNVCATIERLASSEERIPNGKEKGTDASRARIARASLNATGLCDAAYATTGNRLSLTSILPSSMSSGAAEDISPEAQGVIDQIGNAVLYATSSGTLAANLNSILSQSPPLSPVDAEVVTAVASVSQSSFEYWESNIQPLTQQVTASYGGCLSQYYDETTALQTCMGIGSGPAQPTRWRNRPDAGQAKLASMYSRACQDVTAGDVGEADFVGAGLGAIGGIFGPPGILAGAAIGGLGSSALTGWYRVGRLVWCLSRGGTLPKASGT